MQKELGEGKTNEHLNPGESQDENRGGKAIQDRNVIHEGREQKPQRSRVCVMGDKDKRGQKLLLDEQYKTIWRSRTEWPS